MNSLTDLSSEYLDSGVGNILDELDNQLVGLEPVKTRIKEIAALLLVDRARKKLNISSSKPSLHMSFTGGPGTGKTTVAEKISEILHRLGYLRKGHIVSVTRDDLVGQYVGHTAPKTKEMIKRAEGGVLFIDEAYYLHKTDNERDYGIDAIEILLQEMEKNRDVFVVIFAGYKNLMDSFYRSNQGLYSRISHHIDFPDFTNQELIKIANGFLSKESYAFSKDALDAFKEYLILRRELPFFANARSVRNAIDRARLRQANRLFAQMNKSLTRQELITIEASDIRASRVFSGEIEGNKF
tara:strand:+ start:492 stop:1382 length:891 start_codon:yes stop_codon:yes gene_type:complete